MNIEPRELRSKMKNGHTINDICKEYDITFLELMDVFRYYDKYTYLGEK